MNLALVKKNNYPERVVHKSTCGYLKRSKNYVVFDHTNPPEQPSGYSAVICAVCKPKVDLTSLNLTKATPYKGGPYSGIYSVDQLYCDPPKEVDPNWKADALCKEYDTALFYCDAIPENQVHRRQEAIDKVRKVQEICLACPVRPECLWEAIDSGEHYGIWGGATSGQLRRVKANYIREAVS